jgi:hypothetical protein
MRLRTICRSHTTYAHNDPNSAAPRNAFVKMLLPVLRQIAVTPVR